MDQGGEGDANMEDHVPDGSDADELEAIMLLAQSIPGWTRGEEAWELARTSLALPFDPVIVEIGSFLGSGTVLLSGPRRLRGSGRVHCVDPFDCSGDAFSIPHYQHILAAAGGGTLRQHFADNLARAGLADWIEVHQGQAGAVAAQWRSPIDLLFMDGDQSRAGARHAYECWSAFLGPGAIIALHNSNGPREEDLDHDGHYRVVVEEIGPPKYTDIRLIGTTTFARRLR